MAEWETVVKFSLVAWRSVSLALAFSAQAGQLWLYRAELDHVQDLGLVIAAGEFSKGHVQSLARTWLKSLDQDRFALARLTIGTDKDETRRAIFEEKPMHYRASLCHGRTVTPKHPIARVLVLGGKALISVKTQGGFTPTLEWLERGQEDPSLIKVSSGSRFKLLHFAITHGDEPDSLRLFLQAEDTPSERDVRELLRLGRSLAKSPRIVVRVGMFQWVADNYFDMPFRFITDFGKRHLLWPFPPHEQDFYRSPEIVCELAATISCSNFLGRP